jgi:MoaD family protein
MTKVNVKYFGLFRELTKKEKEEIVADTLGELIEEVTSRYREIEEHLHEKTKSDPGLILVYNGNIVNIKEYGVKLKDGDEILIMSIISGG